MSFKYDPYYLEMQAFTVCIRVYCIRAFPLKVSYGIVICNMVTLTFKLTAK